MLNPWNDLLKQETNNNLGAVNSQNMIYDNDNNMLMLDGSSMNNGSNMVSNGMPSMDGSNGHIPSQAQVAAAVATAMMMQNQNNGINK